MDNLFRMIEVVKDVFTFLLLSGYATLDYSLWYKSTFYIIFTELRF